MNEARYQLRQSPADRYSTATLGGGEIGGGGEVRRERRSRRPASTRRSLPVVCGDASNRTPCRLGHAGPCGGCGDLEIRRELRSRRPASACGAPLGCARSRHRSRRSRSSTSFALQREARRPERVPLPISKSPNPDDAPPWRSLLPRGQGHRPRTRIGRRVVRRTPSRRHADMVVRPRTWRRRERRGHAGQTASPRRAAALRYAVVSDRVPVGRRGRGVWNRCMTRDDAGILRAEPRARFALPRRPV